MMTAGFCQRSQPHKQLVSNALILNKKRLALPFKSVTLNKLACVSDFVIKIYKKPDRPMTTSLRLRYQTIEFDDIDIHLCTLRDRQQFYDPTGLAEKLGISSATWPIFGVVWPSSIVLAHYMQRCDIHNKRILEVGCGIGLTSLLLNKQQEDVTATDYHPEVGRFLRRNAELNHEPPIDYQRVDWADSRHDKLGQFDIIIGSDLLYEDQHIELLSDFIARHANARCEVILVDPGRGRKNKLSRRLKAQGFQLNETRPQHADDYLQQDFKGYILHYCRDEMRAA